jgi:hypothetical protein
VTPPISKSSSFSRLTTYSLCRAGSWMKTTWCEGCATPLKHTHTCPLSSPTLLGGTFGNRLALRGLGCDSETDVAGDSDLESAWRLKVMGPNLRLTNILPPRPTGACSELFQQ